MKKNNPGFISEALLILVALIFIKFYFGFDIIAWLRSPGPQKIIQQAWSEIKMAYTWLDALPAKYLKK